MQGAKGREIRQQHRNKRKLHKELASGSSTEPNGHLLNVLHQLRNGLTELCSMVALHQLVEQGNCNVGGSILVRL